MKKRISLALFIMAFASITVYSQPKVYHTTGGEAIFSLSDIVFDDYQVNSNIRFTMFFHTQNRLNIDFDKNLGIFTGLGLRNIGFITEDLYQNVGFTGIDNTHPDWNKEVKIKRRSYSLGIPLAVKIGNMDGVYVFAGGEYEWMFHYKQKLFIDGNKYKYSQWTSNRVNTFIPSVFAGIQLPQGMNVKFTYYLDDFLNPDFSGVDFGENVDYSRFQSTGVFFISLSYIYRKR